MAGTLQVRDGSGIIQDLATTSSVNFTGVIPVHAISEITGTAGLSLSNLTKSIGVVEQYTTSSYTLSGSTRHLYVTSSTNNPVYVSGNLGVVFDGSDTLTVTSSLTNPVYVAVSGTVEANQTFASASVSGTYTSAQAKIAKELAPSADSKSLIISNQANNLLYILLAQTGDASPTSYTYVIDPFATYEAMSVNARVRHSFILNTDAGAAGSVVATYTK